MSANPRKLYSLEEYFALEQASEIRYEYRNGEVFAMSGAQPNHNRIARNLIRLLANRLEGGSCEVFGSDQRVRVRVGSPYLYPDVSVACPQPQFEAIGGLFALVNPTLIIEVLSPTTAADDRNLKFIQYQTIPSFQEYLLVDSTAVQATLYRRQPDGTWLPAAIADLEATIELESIGCALMLRDIYKQVDFSLSEPSSTA